MTLASVLLAASLVACAPENNSTFGTGGDRTGDFGNDTGETANENSPVIEEITGEFTEFSGRWVVLVTIYYTDPNDDIEGGKVHVDLDVGGKPWDLEPLDVDNTSAVADGDTVYFALGGEDNTDIDTSVTYDMEIQLEDAEGNVSNTEEVTVESL